MKQKNVNTKLYGVQEAGKYVGFIDTSWGSYYKQSHGAQVSQSSNPCTAG